MGVGIVLLLAACLGFYQTWWPVFLTAAAALITMLANGLLIANATKSTGDYDSLVGPARGTTNSNGNPQELDFKTCCQGYALVPITVTCIISLAMYKAAADLDDSGQDASSKNQVFAVALLEFLDCGSIVKEDKSTESVDKLTLAFHSKFLHGVMWAVMSYLVIYGLRAVATAKFPSEDGDAEEKRASRTVARAAFGLVIILLVFAAIGFAPVILTAIAFGTCMVASVVMFVQDSTPRMLMQTHAFMTVTLSCIYCLGTLLFEMKAMEPNMDRARVYLHLTGFQQSFFAACWFAATLAVRDAFNAANAMQQR